MKRLILLALLLLASCIPSFTEVENCSGDLCLALEGDSLTLGSSGFSYGGVRVFADAVTSPFCVAPCNAPRGALLRLSARASLYPAQLTLGSVTGLREAHASIVEPGANEALGVTLEANSATP